MKTTLIRIKKESAEYINKLVKKRNEKSTRRHTQASVTEELINNWKHSNHSITQ